MAITNEITVRLVECAKPLNSTSGIIGWNDTNTIPKKGELCLEYTNTGDDVNPHYIYKMKVGDGYHPYTNLEYFPASQNIVSEIVTWVNANLDVTEYAQAEFVAGTTNTDPYVKIYGIKEVDGKIVRGSSYLKITGGTHITIQQSGNDVVIEHTGSSATETTGSALNFGSNVITAVTTDNTGHVTSVTKSPLPQTPNMSTVLSNQPNGATDTVTENPFMNLVSDNRVVSTHQIQSGSKMDVRSVTQEGTFNVVVSHQPTTRTDTTSATQPTALATAITTDTTGHVTEVTTVDPDDVTVGKAKDLESPITENDDTTWNYRETGGEISIGEDIARVNKLKGNTIVWNQLCNDSALKTSGSYNGITYTFDPVTHVVTANGTATGGSSWSDQSTALGSINVQIEENHYYYINGTYGYGSSSNSTGLQCFQDGKVNWSLTNPRIIKSEVSADMVHFRLRVQQGVTVTNMSTRFQCFDLTKLFGSDDAIKAALGVSTLEGQDLVTAATNFEKLFPNTYYPYCEGRLVNLGGYGVKWNQIVNNGNFATTNGWVNGDGASFSISSNIATIEKSGDNAYTACHIRRSIDVAAHKYYVSFKAKSNNDGNRVRIILYDGGDTQIISAWTNYADWTKVSLVFASANANTQFRVYGDNNGDTTQDVSVSVSNIQVIDLTEMFGPGSEPTLEEFEAMFPDDYYEYNEGTEMNIFDAATGENKLGLVSTGFNLWDEEMEIGNISSTTGANVTNAALRRSKNYIPVIGGKTYYCKNGSNIATYVRLYDAEKNYLGSQYTPLILNQSFEIPDNAAYLRFVLSAGYSETYQHDICINHSCDRDGTYEPYKKYTLDLDWVRNIEYTPDGSSTPEKLFPYGLLSAGSVYDEVGENYAIKRVGVVDLGSLTWNYQADNTRWQTSFPKVPKGTLNLLSSIYTTVLATQIPSTSMSIAVSGTSAYLLANTNSTTISPTGMLYYELATPVVVYFDEKKKLTYFVDDHGTEQQLPVNGSSVITSPFVGTFEYKSNFKDAVIDLIDTVNSYKNPVRGQNNTAQTVGELAVYDSDSTVSSSGFKASNGTITTSVTDKDKKLPTIESVIEYVQRMTQSAIHYLGVINSADRLIGPHAMGDMFIAGTTFLLDGKQIDVGDYLIKNSTEYVSGIPLSQLWDVIQGKVSVSNVGATLVMDGTSHHIATVEGTQISITTPNLNVSSPSASSTEISFIDTVSQSDGLLSATKKTIRSASTEQSGVVQFASSIHNSTDYTKAVTAADAWTEFAKRNVKASVVSSTTPASIIPQVVYSSQLPTSGVEPDNWNALVFGRWSSTPLVIGMLYIHLPEKKAYISVGTEAPTDWKMITNI